MTRFFSCWLGLSWTCVFVAVSSQLLAGEPLAPTGKGEAAKWIWSSDASDGTPWALKGGAFFRKVFEIPADAKVREALFDVGVDNYAAVFINGQLAGRYEGWSPLSRLEVGRFLKAGKNVLAVAAGNEEPGPAGLLVSMKIFWEGIPEPLVIATGASWTASSRAVEDWQTSVAGVTGFEPAKLVAENGEPPWGPALPPSAATATFAKFSAESEDMSGLNDMLKRYYAACNMDGVGTYPLAWLTHAILWVGDASPVSESPMRERIANRLARMKMSQEGYVSCHQHEGLGHSEGWPFPMPSQSGGFGFYFSIAGLLYGPEFQVFPVKDLEGWELDNASSQGLEETKGWKLELTGPEATITSPAFEVDALVSPFIRVKWNASDFPVGSQPFIEWTTTTHPDFSAKRRMKFPHPSSSSIFPIQDFDIPIHEITKAEGKITRLRIGFGNPVPGKVTMLRVFSAVDTRHSINNPNYLIAASDYFSWTGDRVWLAANLEKLRRATAYMISEFQVRDAHLLRTPWIGHDGRSGLEYSPDGKKLIHRGVGVGGTYWDLLPFGGDDAIATIYLYQSLVHMAQIEEFVATEKLIADHGPADGLDGRSLSALAEAVRKKFQETFWNPETRRFAAKDNEGRFRDYGFTFLNNEAITYGLASKEQATDILSWLSGERTIEGDTSQGQDIYKFRFGPRATTKRNIDFYGYVWSQPEDLHFGDQVQDGGAVLGFTYHDLMARIRQLGADNAWQRLCEILAWYREVEEAGGARAYYSVPGRGTLQGGGTAGGLGIDEEFYESVLAPAVILDGFIGFSVCPEGFNLDPQIPGILKELKVTNVAYRDLLWDIVATHGRVSFQVRSGEVDSPLRVRLPEGSWSAKILREQDGAEEIIEIPSGPQGFELPAGRLHQLIFTRYPSS